MDKFLDTYIPPRLNQKEVESLNRPITRSEIEAAINSLLSKKSPEPDRFTAKFYQKYKRSCYHSFWNYSKQYKKRESSPTHFMRPSSSWYQNLAETQLKKRNFRPIFMMNTDMKILNTGKPNSTAHQKVYSS